MAHAMAHGMCSMEQPHEAGSRFSMPLVGFAGCEVEGLLPGLGVRLVVTEHCCCSTHFNGVSQGSTSPVHGQALDGSWVQPGSL